MHLASIVTALALVAPTPPPPPTPLDPLSVVNRVFSSPDPEAAHAALSPAQLAAFNTGYLIHHRETSIQTRPAPLGCNYARAKHAVKAAGGNTLYTFWTEIHWCHDRGRGWHSTYVTGPGTGGETQTPGYTYKGVTALDAGEVGTSRGWAQHWFEVRFLPDSKVCLRVYLTDRFETRNDDRCSLA